MKYAGVIVVMVVSLVAFSGCATLAGKVGIASEDYVTAQVEAARASLQMEIDTTNKKLEAAQSEIDQYFISSSISHTTGFCSNEALKIQYIQKDGFC